MNTHDPAAKAAEEIVISHYGWSSAAIPQELLSIIAPIIRREYEPYMRLLEQVLILLSDGRLLNGTEGIGAARQTFLAEAASMGIGKPTTQPAPRPTPT